MRRHTRIRPSRKSIRKSHERYLILPPPVEQTHALSQVGRLIESKMSQYKPPPPPHPMMQRHTAPAGPIYRQYQMPQFAQPSPGEYQLIYPTSEHHPAPKYVRARPLSSDVLHGVSLSADALAVDIDATFSQIALPPNPTYGQFLTRIRDFDRSPNLGGWHPRPPPSPIDPADQAKLPREQQMQNEQTYR